MTISIIIPCFNAANYLENTINSILKQTYKDFEIIIVDDGSTDETAELCRKLSAAHTNIRYIYQCNQGPSAARNHGLKVAEGEYITFADADDYVEENFLSSFTQHIDSKCELIAAGHKTASLFNNSLSNIKTINLQEEVCRSTANCALAFFNRAKEGYYPFFVYGKLYKRNLIQKHSIEFPVECSLGEDRVFLLRYLEHTNNIKFIANCNYIILSRAELSQTRLSSKKRSLNSYFSCFSFNYEQLIKSYSKFKLPIIKSYADNYIVEKLFTFAWVSLSSPKDIKDFVAKYKNFALLSRNVEICNISNNTFKLNHLIINTLGCWGGVSLSLNGAFTS